MGVTASSTENAQSRQQPSEDPASAAAVIAPTNKDNATKTSNWYDENSQPAKDTSTVPSRRTDIEAPDGTYKGVANYQNFIQKKDDQQYQQLGKTS